MFKIINIKLKNKTYELINNLKEINVDKSIVISAFEIKKLAKGFNLELYDCIIAATALEYDLILVTRNAKHYPDKRLKIFMPEY